MYMQWWHDISHDFLMVTAVRPYLYNVYWEFVSDFSDQVSILFKGIRCCHLHAYCLDSKEKEQQCTVKARSTT